ncbi:hypothetical protein [Anabaena sp. UHCC 0187]|uniref:hypothetical protein n=1 Tax=Anabaena sp. UHCC 0187 TaxID=2590018 RepID=UPI0020C48322|nr:hypothetical protein [Anabaena sp. UHCC 0187]
MSESTCNNPETNESRFANFDDDEINLLYNLLRYGYKYSSNLPDDCISAYDMYQEINAEIAQRKVNEPDNS